MLTDSSAGPRVLVDSDDFYAVLAGVRGLRRAGYRPWLLVPPGNNYAARSRAVEGKTQIVSPEEDPQGFAVVAAATAVRVGADIVLPGTEAALVALAAHRDCFGGVELGAPLLDVAMRATDKLVLSQLAAAAGIATPETLLLDRDELSAYALQFPVIVKPVRTKTRVAGGLAHGKASVARDREALARASAALPGDRVVVQPFVDGVLGAVAGVAWEGELVCAVHQRAERVSPPDAGISSLARTVPPDSALEAGVARLIALLAWSGIFQLQFVHTHDAAYAIDFNPRMYGSLGLAIAAGANLPAVWADLLCGVEPRGATYRQGVAYRSEEKELQAFVFAVRRGDLRTALDVFVPRLGATHAAFARDDPMPLLATVEKAYGSLRQTRSATSAHNSSTGRVESSRTTRRRSWWRR